MIPQKKLNESIEYLNYFKIKINSEVKNCEKK